VISVKKKEKRRAGTCWISGKQKHNEINITPNKINAIYVDKEADRFHPTKEQDLSNYKTNDMVNGGGPLQIWSDCDLLNTRDNLYFSNEMYT